MANSGNDKPKLKPGDPGYVGRGVPPTHSRIQPGETRNPWGRKGKAGANDAAIGFPEEFAALLDAPISAQDGKSVTLAQLAYNRLLKKVNAGDLPSIKYVVELREKYGSKLPPAETAAMTQIYRKQLVDDALGRLQSRHAFLQDDCSNEVAWDRDQVGEPGQENSGS